MLRRIVNLGCRPTNAAQCAGRKDLATESTPSSPRGDADVAGSASKRMRGHVLSILRNSVAAALLLSVPRLRCAPAFAETIGGALAKAYTTIPTLNSARAGVRVTDENVAIAKSAMRPIIAGQSSLDYTSTAGGNRLTTGSFGVEIQQTLFDGFQTRNNVRTAEARVRAADESLRNTEQNILFNAASAFMDVIRDRQIAVLRARNLEFLEEQVRAARSRFEVGEGTRTDVAQAEASRSSAVAQLAAARAQALASAATYHQIVGEEPGKLTSPRAGQGPAQGSRLGDRDRQYRASGDRRDRASGRCRRLSGQVGGRLAAAAGFGVGQRVAQLPQHGARTPSSPTTAPSIRASVGLQLTVPIYQGGRRRGAGAPVQGIARPGAHRGRRHPRPGPRRRRLGLDAVRCRARKRRRPTATWSRPPNWR